MVVRIGNKLIGEDNPVMVVAEIGINHNGDIDIARRLISSAQWAGADAVKFQKRTVDMVYSMEELDKPRETPFGTTNGDYKWGIEFGQAEYAAINRYCRKMNDGEGMMWFASCWDEDAVDFIDQFDPPCYKIASACLTDDDLLAYTRAMGKPIILSTGMSTMDQIRHAVHLLGQEDLVILHCTSTYPCKEEELNLNCIPMLAEEFDCPIGYSGHEVGIPSTEASVVLGASMVERHITLGRSMWGSDQAASVEPTGFEGMIRHIKGFGRSLGDGVKRVYDSELPIIEKLRRVDTLGSG